MTTIDQFIIELQSISSEKRQLPLVIIAPNGLEISPKIKMLWDDQMEMFQKGPDKMIITY